MRFSPWGDFKGAARDDSQYHFITLRRESSRMKNDRESAKGRKREEEEKLRSFAAISLFRVFSMESE
jgi:hypothetical protein